MFFKKDYATPGPGIDPNAPEKKGFDRLAEILTLECVTLVKLNLLFLVSCVPLITIPGAVYALNQVVRRMVLDQPVLCFYHYRKAWKSWKRAYASFFAAAIPLCLSGYGVWFYLSQAMRQLLFLAPFLLCSTVFLVTMLSVVYFYGLLATDRPLKECLRFAVLLGAGRPLRAVLAALSVFGTLTAAMLSFPLSAIYLLLIGFSAPCLLGHFFTRTVLKKFGGDPDEDQRNHI